MDTKSHRQRLFLNRLFNALTGLGILIAIIGLGLDLLPGSSPGISVPQLMMILGGCALLTASLLLRQARIRQRITQNLFKNLLISCVALLITLVVLEIGLTVANVQPRYPSHVPEKFLDAVPWWTCSESGCHYDYDPMMIACEQNDVSGRRCMVNHQGFHDSQDFVASEDHVDRLRILMLGDSFTFGGTAEIGSSFVETLERNMPDAVIWNTGIPGAGTNQAVATLQTYAPVLKSQVAILGFFMNDFEDNMFPIDSYFMGMDADKYPYAIRQYMTDNLGKVTKLSRQMDLYYRYNQVDPPDSELERVVGTTRLGSLLLNTLETIEHVISKADGIRVSRQVEVTYQYLTELRDYAAENNIDLLVLVIPRREDIGSPGTLFKNTIDLLNELDVPYINPIDILDATTDYAPAPDIHWSTEGHQKIGTILTDCLQAYERQGTISSCDAVQLK